MISFIGREGELERIEVLLTSPDCQLLTLVGPGGIGKTQLARQLEQRSASAFPDGVIFVDLTNIDTPQSLLPAIGDRANVSLSWADDRLGQLVSVWQGKSLLLILDNFEHLLDAVDQLADLIAALPSLTILVTSRVVLRLRAERLYPVAGLAVAEQDPTSSDAVALFIERAQAVSPGFSAEEQLDSIVALCRLLDGVPLALEMAAPWVRLLSVEQIIAEVNASLDFLTHSARDIPDRHQSLRAVFHGSWGKLTEQEQRGLQRLSVFRGSFDHQAASIVDASLANLAHLTDKSLLQADAEGRFSLHMVIREYAAEHLAQSDAYAEMQRRHSHYYARLAKQAEAQLKGPQQAEALNQLDHLIDNIRAGWGWAISQQDVGLLQDYMLCILIYYQIRCRPEQSIELLQRAKNELPADHPFHFSLNIHLCWLYIETGLTYDGLGLVASYIREAVDFECFEGLSLPLNVLAWHKEYFVTDYERVRLIFLHNREQAELAGEHWEAGFACQGIGQIALHREQYAEAREALEAGLGHFETIQDVWGATWVLGTLGRVAYEEQQYQEAMQLFERSYSICEQLGDMTGCEYTIREMANVALSLGNEHTTAHYLLKSVHLAMQFHYRNAFLTYPLQMIMRFLADLDSYRATTVELAALLLANPYVHAAWWQSEIDALQQFLEDAKAKLPPDQAEVAQQRGAAMTFVEAAEHSITLLEDIRDGDRLPEPAVNPTLDEPLTPRELEVLHLLAEGQSNRQIAEALTVSLGTAKTHVHNISTKLDASNRTEAVALARELGLL